MVAPTCDETCEDCLSVGDTCGACAAATCLDPTCTPQSVDLDEACPKNLSHKDLLKCKLTFFSVNRTVLFFVFQVIKKD